MPFTVNSEGRTLSSLFSTNETNSENLLVEKENLICVFKLVIKDLLDSSLRHERLVEKEYFPIKHFFIVFEQILLHGYSGKKSFPLSSSSARKDLWPLIDLIVKKSSDTQTTEISLSSKEMTNIRTSLGRVRAWLRLAVMQKRLADYFQLLIEQKSELKDFYESDALLLSDESVIITGLLVGLNVLDFNFCLKEMNFDYPVEPPIHYSLYLRERRIFTSKGNASSTAEPIDELDSSQTLNDETGIFTETNDIDSIDENPTDSSRLANILDQKNYVEELNRNLQRNFAQLQERLQTIEQTNKTLTEENLSQKSKIDELEETLTKLNGEKDQIQSTFQRKLDALQADIAVERETYQKSRAGLDQIYHELQKKYEDERSSKEKIENVYQTQLSQTNEYLQSTKLMEKDIETKTTLYDLMKEENQRLIENFCSTQLKLQTVERENEILKTTIGELEKNIEEMTAEKHALDEMNERLSQTLAKSDAEKSTFESSLRQQEEIQQQLKITLANEEEKISRLQFDLHELNLMKKEFEIYKETMTTKEHEFERKMKEQDETIVQLALKLETSIKRADEFREKDDAKSRFWMKDEDAKECCKCNKEFNAIRRKHHCRKCGHIFCETCASTRLPVAGSKPVRVCDHCCESLLAQCVVNA